MRKLLLDRGVLCVDAQELVGKVSDAQDGEHFEETAGETVAQSVVQLINTGKKLRWKVAPCQTCGFQAESGRCGYKHTFKDDNCGRYVVESRSRSLVPPIGQTFWRSLDSLWYM